MTVKLAPSYFPGKITVQVRHQTCTNVDLAPLEASRRKFVTAKIFLNNIHDISAVLKIDPQRPPGQVCDVDFGVLHHRGYTDCFLLRMV